MIYSEIKDKFLDFFKEKGHKVLPSFSLIPPELDPSLLLVNAGMVPLKSYFLSQRNAEEELGTKKIITIQKCLRTADIEMVGKTARHLTFFEMLGNFSFGDYFKEEAIKLAFQFLTEKLNLPKENFHIAVFGGEGNIPADKESAKIWRKLGILKIYEFGMADNFWGPPGVSGPCGPNTEIHYDRGEKFKKGKCTLPLCGPNCECGRFIEIWNLVFMEYFKNEEGKFSKLPQRNVDTGMGLERLLMILEKKESVFEIEKFLPLIKEIENISGQFYKTDEKKRRLMQVIADHIKASVFMISDGVLPSNIDRGYILRRLLRRAIRYGCCLGIEQKFCTKIAKRVIEIYKDFYPEIREKEKKILEELNKEEEKFIKLIQKAPKKIKKITKELKYTIAKEFYGKNIVNRIISGKDAFDIYQTYGIPIEIIEEEAKKEGFKVNRKEFQKEFKKHQEISRAGLKKKFKGGLADESEKTVKLHTATHLLLAGLRKILGPHVHQRGSNINSQRLRFDFSHPEKPTKEEILKVEDFVNQAIAQKLEVFVTEIDFKTAKKLGVEGEFEERYKKKVKVYTIGRTLKDGGFISAEICGGPHVKNIGDLGHFKIIKEESSAAGIRRIKAILE